MSLVAYASSEEEREEEEEEESDGASAGPGALLSALPPPRPGPAQKRQPVRIAAPRLQEEVSGGPGPPARPLARPPA